MNQRLQIIQNKLRRLISLDKEHTIFGASAYSTVDNGHKYKLNPTITLTELEEFEKKYQIILPEEYKLYLSTIANGGVGPHYG
ncbi:MAG: SMI1/KNR4 family protein, partial [Daejeonella sp.]